MKKIAVFGSAFNPPSFGHLSVIERLSHFDLVLLVPSIAHAWGKQMLDYPVRCDLVEAFISDIECHNVTLSRIEETLQQGDSSVTTFQVLEALQREHPESDITFVMGPDNLFSFSKFARAEEIVQRWSVLTCPETVPVRSTIIRERVASDHNIDDMTTFSVIEILHKRNLYHSI